MSISSGLLIEAFTPQTLTETADGQGGVTTGWADGTAFRGRLSTLSADERMAQDKASVFATHKIYTDVVTITAAQRIRNSDSTRYYQIKGIVKPSNLSTGHLEIMVREID